MKVKVKDILSEYKIIVKNRVCKICTVTYLFSGWTPDNKVCPQCQLMNKYWWLIRDELTEHFIYKGYIYCYDFVLSKDSKDANFKVYMEDGRLIYTNHLWPIFKVEKLWKNLGMSDNAYVERIGGYSGLFEF